MARPSHEQIFGELAAASQQALAEEGVTRKGIRSARVVLRTLAEVQELAAEPEPLHVETFTEIHDAATDELDYASKEADRRNLVNMLIDLGIARYDTETQALSYNPSRQSTL